MLTKELIGKNVSLEGITNKVSETYLICTEALFVCPDCACEMNVVQDEEKIQEPKKCQGCRRKFNFELKTKELIEQKDFVLHVDNERIRIYLRGTDLITKFDKIKSNSVKLSGIVQEESEKKSVIFELIVMAEEIEENE